MTVTVRLFAMLREAAGTATVDLPALEAPTAGRALAAAAARTGIGELVADLRPALAVNRAYASADAPVVDGDEVAVIPPVSGGGGARIHVAVGREPLSLEAVVARVRDPRAGAIVTFQGEPREVDALDYEAYAEMAEDRMRAVLEAVSSQHGVIAAAAEHRIGTVPAGEACVLVAVAAPHRAEAFDAARSMIDRIKADVPIWKREIDGTGRRWVVPEAGHT